MYIIVYNHGARGNSGQHCIDIEEVKDAIQRALELDVLRNGGEIKIYQDQIAA